MRIMKCSQLSLTLTSSSTATLTIKSHCAALVRRRMKPHNLSISDVRKLSSSSLLSTSYSSSWFNLRNRWMEYQGSSNWGGLLDPLDDNLRAEILRYGKFVEVAYKCFQFDPSSPSYTACRFPKNKLFDRCGLPTTGYKVTKYLRVTSRIELPRWVERASSWVARKSSNIGYVAVCDNKGEIKRLGRRDVVIAFRGTITCLEWLENLRANLTFIPARGLEIEVERHGPMVESGFLSLYTSAASASLSLQQMVHEEIRRILQTYGGEALSLTLTGHSLGAALATLTAYDIQTAFRFEHHTPMVTVISFGGPRVGNQRFRKQLEKQGTRVLRIVNSDDVVTKVPGFVFEGDDDVANKRDGHVARWIKKWLEDAPWTFAEVGKELRLCSRDSPYLSGINVATCHDLNTYLHLVDGFVSSTCPFKATTKRFLRR